MFEYLQVLEVIPAGKGKKNFEIYQRKQYLKAQLDCYKTAKFGSLYSRGKNQNISFNSLLYINVCFMAMILHVLFLKLLKLLTCYLVFEVNVYIQIKAFGFLNYLRYS